MNTHHMKYFVDAARAGSLLKAAAQNFVTHSAVSQAIRTLERELGVELLVHEKRKFVLTREGDTVLLRFEEWLQELEDLKLKLSSQSDVPSGKLKVIAAQSLMATSINEVLLRFRTLYPLVKVTLKPGTASAVHASLLSGESDVGILVDHHLLTE
ncbi:MAG: LysR family transcriptional regulator [Proteobacteria bacterium]|nr:MAG: LysR family transcriptional regulator [Pseudomonadota bacterium]